MRLVYLLSLVFVCPLLLTSCESVNNYESPEAFTTEKIMKIHVGMSSDEILAMFGTPKNISSGVCGTSNNKPWNCTTWVYGNPPYESASFTFNGMHGSYILNDFKIDRD